MFGARGLRLAAREALGLAAWTAAGLDTEIRHAVRSADGSERLVIGLADGECVETVAMADDAVCVSTQVGCAVGCRFCASGIDGLVRNLAVHEILEQVVHARRRRPAIDRVVFMGIGEPTHNLDAVLQAAQVLAADGGIPARRQTLSTVGSSRAFERLAAGDVLPTLALSLHAADDALRQQLLPRAGCEPVVALVRAAEAYGRACGRPVQVRLGVARGHQRPRRGRRRPVRAPRRRARLRQPDPLQPGRHVAVRAAGGRSDGVDRARAPPAGRAGDRALVGGGRRGGRVWSAPARTVTRAPRSCKIRGAGSIRLEDRSR